MDDMMKRYTQNIVDKIVQVAKEENKQLLDIAKNDLNSKIGIFHMPELAFAYECGKQIMQNANEIFESNIPKWCREAPLKDAGPSDLVFEFSDNTKIVIEFKMRGKGPAYIRDINKLEKLVDKKYIKLFCAIVDTFTEKLPYDGRIETVDDDERTEQLYLNSFKTNQTWYESEVYGLVGIWKVNSLKVGL